VVTFFFFRNIYPRPTLFIFFLENFCLLALNRPLPLLRPSIERILHELRCGSSLPLFFSLSPFLFPNLFVSFDVSPHRVPPPLPLQRTDALKMPINLKDRFPLPFSFFFGPLFLLVVVLSFPSVVRCYPSPFRCCLRF